MKPEEKIQQLKYVEVLESLQNEKCPVCGGDQLTYDPNYRSDNGNIFLNAACDCCGAWWTEILMLMGVRSMCFSGTDEETNEEIYVEDAEIRGDISEITMIPQLLIEVLKNKEILPTLLGIDKGFDKLIAERLKDE